MGQRTRVDLTGVDALASRLQDAAPLFFDGAARTFYRARELLQAARDARDGRDHQTCAETVARSLEMLLGVPLAGDPTAVMAELADLRCFHGLVALPLAAAAAAAESAVAGDGVGSLGVGAAQPSAASAASPKPTFGQARQISNGGGRQPGTNERRPGRRGVLRVRLRRDPRARVGRRGPGLAARVARRGVRRSLRR